MEFLDFRDNRKGPSIEVLFPGWKKRGEAVAFLSPHDDDVVLGAGYLVRAVLEAGGRPVILVFCKGDAGYATTAARHSIVRTRRAEADEAYRTLGVGAADIHFFGIPDLSLMTYVNRKVPGKAGVLDRFIGLLRTYGAGHVVFSSPNFENWDHTAVFNLGMYAAPQAGDPILADLGPLSPVTSGLVYSVWGDFEAPDGEPGPLRADAAVLAGEKEERLIRRALRAFASQAAVMGNTVAGQRDARKGPGGWLELYQRARVRRPIDYGPYFERVNKMGQRRTHPNGD
jgi:LmbE family N-acetylglucosaminyl deacetylase